MAFTHTLELSNVYSPTITQGFGLQICTVIPRRSIAFDEQILILSLLGIRGEVADCAWCWVVDPATADGRAAAVAAYLRET